MIALGTQVPELTTEHADGTIWADVEGDIWSPCPFGWVVTRRVPFQIVSDLAHPGPVYGPYTAVLAPPVPTEL